VPNDDVRDGVGGQGGVERDLDVALERTRDRAAVLGGGGHAGEAFRIDAGRRATDRERRARDRRRAVDELERDGG
jgi:hypothetical protein